MPPALVADQQFAQAETAVAGEHAGREHVPGKPAGAKFAAISEATTTTPAICARRLPCMPI